MRVVIFEEDAALGAALADAVRRRGHAAALFQTGEAAWARLRREPCALLLADRTLPRTGGLALCRRVRRLPWGREAVIVVLAARAGPADLAAALDAGADDVLVAPFERGLLDLRLSAAERQVAALRARGEAEEAVRFQAHLLNTVGQAVAATDLQGIVTYWNRAAERLPCLPSAIKGRLAAAAATC